MGVGDYFRRVPYMGKVGEREQSRENIAFFHRLSSRLNNSNFFSTAKIIFFHRFLPFILVLTSQHLYFQFFFS